MSDEISREELQNTVPETKRATNTSRAKKNAYGRVDAKASTPKPSKPKAKRRTRAQIQIDEDKKRLLAESRKDVLDAISKLQSLGFVVDIPQDDDSLLKHKESMHALGFVTKEPEETLVVQDKLRARLHFRHMAGMEVYGPGDIELDLNQDALFRTLVLQDSQCLQAHRDSKEYNPEPRSYMIMQKRFSNNPLEAKFAKVEVSSTDFNDMRVFNSHVGIDTRNIASAGYNPNPSNRF